MKHIPGLLAFAAITAAWSGFNSMDTLRWIAVAGLAAFGLWGWRQIDGPIWALIAWIGFMAISIPGTDAPFVGLEAVLHGVALLGVVLCVRQTAHQPIATWVAVAAGTQLVLAALQFAGFDPLVGVLGTPQSTIQTGDASYGIHGTFGHRNVLAGVLVASAPLAWLRFGWPLALALALTALGTGSQGAILSIVGLLGIVLLVKTHGPKRWALVVGGTIALALVGSQVVKQGADGRLPIWRNSVEIIAKHPMRGVGAGQFTNAYTAHELQRLTEQPWDSGGTAAKTAHNEVLHSATETGIPGGLAFCLALGLPILIGMRSGGKERETRTGLAMLGSLLGHSLVSFPFQMAASTLLAAVGIGLILGPWKPTNRPLPRIFGRLLAPCLVLAALARGAADHQSATAGEQLSASQPEAAEQSAAAALRWFPDEPYASYRMGLARWKQGNLRGAAHALRDSIRANKHHVGLRDLGLVLAEAGDAAGAVEMLEAYLRIHPGSSPRAWLVLGAQQIVLGDADAALDTFVRCQCPDGYDYAGRMLHQKEQIPEALWRWRQMENDSGWTQIIRHHLANAEWTEAEAALTEISETKRKAALQLQIDRLKPATLPGSPNAASPDINAGR